MDIVFVSHARRETGINIYGDKELRRPNRVSNLRRSLSRRGCSKTHLEMRLETSDHALPPQHLYA